MKKKADEITIEDLLAEATPRTATARILLRQDLIAEHERLDAELAAAIADEERRDTNGPGLTHRLSDLEAEMKAAQREFAFRALSRRAWADLLAQHPPTKDQLKANPRVDHNPETFPIAAIAASCVTPALTVENVKALEDRLNTSQFDLLWQACLEANMGVRVPKSLLVDSMRHVNEALRGSLSSSASRDPSSSDG